MAGPEAGTKATIGALCANTGIAIAKFVAFVFTGSASMLAEAIHSVADATNQLLLLFGMRRARREATPMHPFGYGRERYFWSFIVAVVLFTVGGVVSIYEGIEKLHHPHEVASYAWPIAVLLVAIVFESVSMAVAVNEANQVRRSGWIEFIRRAKSPELPVVLLEDAGALLGLIFALVGIVLAATTGEPHFDASGSIAIGVLLCIIAIVLAVELRSLLLGESASPADLEAIEEAMRADPKFAGLIHMRTQHIGPDELLVGAKISLHEPLTVDEVAAAIDRIERRVRERVPAARIIYLEPDMPQRTPAPS